MWIALQFPPAILSGHANGNQRWAKIRATRDLRADAEAMTRALDGGQLTFPEKGDIAIEILFVPPDDRGDRINYPARIKPQIDGIAAALGFNDKRLLPTYRFAPIEKPGRVIYTIGE